MTATRLAHQCPKTSCPRMVPQHQFACGQHWFALSLPTRRAIVRAYSTGDFAGHAQAMLNATVELNGVVT